MTSSPDGEGGGQPKDDEWWHDDEGGGGGKRWQKVPRPSFQRSFSAICCDTPNFLLGGGRPIKKNTLYVWFYVPKERIVTLIVVTGCERPSTVVRNPTYAVLSRKQVSRELHARWGGGSQKVTNDDEGEGGGHDTPQNWWRHLWTAP